jgi:hypothetical protein
MRFRMQGIGGRSPQNDVFWIFVPGARFCDFFLFSQVFKKSNVSCELGKGRVKTVWRHWWIANRYLTPTGQLFHDKPVHESLLALSFS